MLTGSPAITLPKLSEYDPPTAAEGSIDPLGLYAIADRLATRLAPGIRERQSHPRFLTVTAVSLDVCRAFDDERVAKDGVSEPWQVFEWYVVEGLVRHSWASPDEIRGVPGTDKVRRAVDDRVPVSAARYLKTPTAFGFHAVYRVLARELNVELAGHLGETGYQLLTTWADEQGLDGFVGTSGGEGARWREALVQAVSGGLGAGAVGRSGGWAGWQFVGRHLAPRRIGSREAGVLQRALYEPGGGFREPLLRFLVSPRGREPWESTGSERRFHEALLQEADTGLRMLLGAVMLYETFSRLLQDAFEDYRRAMSLAQRRLSPAARSGLLTYRRSVPAIRAALSPRHRRAP